MKVIRAIIYYSFLLLFQNNLFSQNVSADIILNRHREFLINSKEAISIDSILDHYDKGRWTNIDYADVQRAGWRLSEHLNNVLSLSIEYVDRKSEYRKSQQLKSVIDGALQLWVARKFKNSNWWHNEIGIPMIMRDIVTVLKDDLTQAELESYLSIIGQHVVKGTGANLTWSADIGIYYSLLTKDLKKVKEYSALLQNEVRISEGEGLKPDFSFHQHNARLQMFQYGASFMLTNTRLAWELKNTEWEYSDDKVNLLIEMLLKGWQWMARGVNTVPGTMDRSITRVNATKAADVTKYIPLFIDLAPGRKSELLLLNKPQLSGKSNLTGFKYFPYSDMTTYHRPGFSFFLKTISTRTLPTERINNENLRGKLLNSGDHYFVRSGNEYYNVMPIWDWERLPGVTSFTNASFIIRKDFVGSVGNQQSGLTAMDYAMKDSQNTKIFSAKKFWVNHGDYTVCLMAGIKMSNLDTAFTTLDQCRILEYVYINNKKISFGNYKLKPFDYVYQNKLVYMPVFKERLHLRTGEVSGSWYPINNSYSNAPISENVIMPYINHYRGSEHSGYVVAYAKNRHIAKKISKRNRFEIISNDSLKQVLVFDGKTFFGAFYNASSFESRKINLSVNRPVLLMLSNGYLSVSDPLHKGGFVKVSINDKIFKIALQTDGITSTIKL